MKPILLAWAVVLIAAVPIVSFTQDKKPASDARADVKKLITGNVQDDKGNPLEGAIVEAKGTKVKVISGNGGAFTINVPGEVTVVVVSYVGMTTKEVALEGKRDINVRLDVAGKDLNDVIVLGYGAKQTQRESPFAAAKVKGTEIQDIPAPNIAGALRGRVAGLSVNAQSGRPGSSISLNIRNSAVSTEAANMGLTTEPLYVIDDIIVGKGTFDALDPNMIEDLSIVKDAAAAMYGAAGAKGVILVRTKRGKPGKSKFSYSGFAGVNDATRLPDMLSAYELASVINETNKLRYTQETGDNLVFSDSALAVLKALDAQKQESWVEQLWQRSLIHRHSLNLSGGSENVTFNLSGSFQNNNGNYAGIKNDRFSTRGNLSVKLANSLRADVNFNIDNSLNTSNNPISPNDQQFLERIIVIPRWVPNKINGLWVNPVLNSNGGRDNFNPWAQIESGYYQTQRGRGNGLNASLMFAPESGILKGLSAKFTVSQTSSNSFNQRYVAPYKLYGFEMANGVLYKDVLKDTTEVNARENAQLTRSNSESSGYRLFFTIGYARELGDHKFSIMGTGEQSESNNSGLDQTWTTQNIPGYDDPFAFATPATPKASKGESALRSYLSRFSYSYAGKYSIDGIARFDATSNFARGKVWGVSPTVGVSWIISSEPFFRDRVKFVNYLKLRTSLGITGDNRVNQRLWQERYKVSVNSAAFGDYLSAGLKSANFPNPDLTWERKRTLNVGVEVAVLKNRLNIGVDMFQNYTYDGFDKNADASYPLYSGFKAPVVNYQKRYAWGSEFSISYNQPFRGDWNLKAGVNFGFANSVLAQATYNYNKLWINFPDEWQYGIGTDPRTYNTGNFGLISKGMFRTQGDVDAYLAQNPGYMIYGTIPQAGWLYYEDVNKDGVITDADKTTMYKTTDPWLATNGQISLSHKAFTVNVNIGASFGGKVFYDDKIRSAKPSPYKNVSREWLDQWRPDNINGRFPRNDDPSIGKESTFWASDGTLIRVNDMTVAYQVPPSVSKRIGLANVRVNLSGNNLWILKNPTPYKDPYSGYIYDYPTLRTITAGLNIGF